MYTDEITSIVIDAGAHTTKAGYSGDGQPKIASLTLVQEDLNEIKKEEVIQMDIEQENKIMKENFQKQYINGENSLYVRKDNVSIVPLIKHGNYLNWDALEQYLENLIEKQLNIKNIDEYPLLMSEPSIHDKEARLQMSKIIFEKFKIKNFFLVKQACLSSFSMGRSTSIVFDSGHSQSITVPVHDGYALQKNIVKFGVGGQFISDKIYQHLCKQGIVIHPRYETQNNTILSNLENENVIPLKKNTSLLQFPKTHESYAMFCRYEIINDIKHQLFQVVENEMKFENQEIAVVNYELPDGTEIKFGNERQEIPDLLFNPQIISAADVRDLELFNYKGVHQQILDSINFCDIDLKRELYNNIIACGGNTLLYGFTEKLQKKINFHAPPNVKIKLIAYPNGSDRKFSSWIGGSILASLGSFQNLWVSKQEFDEYGPYIVEKRCP